MHLHCYQVRLYLYFQCCKPIIQIPAMHISQYIISDHKKYNKLKEFIFVPGKMRVCGINIFY